MRWFSSRVATGQINISFISLSYGKSIKLIMNNFKIQRKNIKIRTLSIIVAHFFISHNNFSFRFS